MFSLFFCCRCSFARVAGTSVLQAEFCSDCLRVTRQLRLRSFQRRFGVNIVVEYSGICGDNFATVNQVIRVISRRYKCAFRPNRQVSRRSYQYIRRVID